MRVTFDALWRGRNGTEPSHINGWHIDWGREDGHLVGFCFESVIWVKHCNWFLFWCLSSSFIWIIHFFVLYFVCICMHTFLCVAVHADAWYYSSGVNCFLFFFWRHNLSLPCRWQTRLCLLTRDPKNSACLHLPGARIASTCHHTQNFPGFWEPKPGASWFHSKHFIDRDLCQPWSRTCSTSGNSPWFALTHMCSFFVQSWCSLRVFPQPTWRAWGVFSIHSTMFPW